MTPHRLRLGSAKTFSIPSKELFLGPNPPGMLPLISRPGLFKLIQRSSKPEVRAFDRRVRHEVLPQDSDQNLGT